MAKKPTVKEKCYVRLRQKALSGGNISLYLDIYKDGQRQYEFLKLYLIPETTSNPKAKEKNKETMMAATAIKNQRENDIIKGEAGLINTHRSKILLNDWMEFYKSKKLNKSKATIEKINVTQRLLNQYSGGKKTLANVDKRFCEGFLNYLNEYVSELTHQQLTGSTLITYCSQFNGALNYAVRSEIIIRNPMQLVELDLKPKKQECQRVYLTVDEQKKLIETECNPQIFKQAFLFSCFCGLRFSDVVRLEWENLTESDGNLYAVLRQKKTDEPIYLKIGKKAQQWLPKRPNETNNEPIFKGVKYGACAIKIAQWAKQAGITKHVTFHTARHSFATNELTAGVDLYTLSKMLGHKEIRTTQIYGKIIDQKKDEAIDKLDNLF